MYNEKGILWKSILEIQGIPLIVIPYRYGVLTEKIRKLTGFLWTMNNSGVYKNC